MLGAGPIAKACFRAIMTNLKHIDTVKISKCKRKRHWITAKSMGSSYVLKGRKEDAYERKINPMENLSLYESKKN